LAHRNMFHSLLENWKQIFKWNLPYVSTSNPLTSYSYTLYIGIQFQDLYSFIFYSLILIYWWWVYTYMSLSTEEIPEVHYARSKLDGVLQTLVEQKDDGYIVTDHWNIWKYICLHFVARLELYEFPTIFKHNIYCCYLFVHHTIEQIIPVNDSLVTDSNLIKNFWITICEIKSILVCCSSWFQWYLNHPLPNPYWLASRRHKFS